MQKNRQQLLYLLFAILTVTGCSQADESPKTLLLTLVAENSDFRVTGYQVLDRLYQHSPQQGNFQAHLLDKEQKVMREVTFERFDFSSAQNPADNEEFTLSLPLVSGLATVVIYRLDGSSGHYQLKTDDPLLEWTLPKTVKEKGSTAKR